MSWDEDWENSQDLESFAPKTYAKYRGNISGRDAPRSRIFEMMDFARLNDFAGKEFHDWVWAFGAALSYEIQIEGDCERRDYWPGRKTWFNEIAAPYRGRVLDQRAKSP